jgi:hypothetical protein
MRRLAANELRLLLLVLIVLLLFIMAMTIAVGNVKKDASYGLDEVIHLFGYLTAAASGWAFGKSDQK